MRQAICWITGMRYAYRVRMEYRHKISGHVIASMNKTIYLSHPRLIEKHREIKKACDLSPLMESLKRSDSLCSGTLILEPICYLGYFRMEE